MVEAGQPWLHDLITVLSAPTMMLSEADGQLRPSGAQGVLHANSRVLSQAVVTVDGAEPAPMSAGLLAADSAMFASIARWEPAGSASPAVWLSRQRSAGPGVVSETLRITGSPDTRGTAEVTLRVSADFAMLTDIKAGKSAAAVPLRAVSGGLEWGDSSLAVQLSAAGAAVMVSPDGSEGQLTWQVQLADDQETEISWQLAVHDETAIVGAPAGEPGLGRPGASPSGNRTHAAGNGTHAAAGNGGTAADNGGPADGNGAAAAHNGTSAAHNGSPGADNGSTRNGGAAGHNGGAAGHGGAGGRSGGLASSWRQVRAVSADPRLPRLLAQSMEDATALRMVTSRAPGEVFLGAGAPWYLTLFGRDSIWAARLMLPFGWQLARGTLRTLAAFQGQRVDPMTGEAPGKIPHELRPTTRVPTKRALPPLYYGTIDATPLWICLLHDAWRWGMPAQDVRSLLPALTGALAWMRDYGDTDGDGLLEYRDESGQGLANQGWKDSHDAVRFADGRIADAPVTLCEVQGYAYQAAMAGADLLDAFGQPGAAQWRVWAAGVAAAFRDSFWIADAGGSYPALALDAAKCQVDSLTSNIGHLLGTGMLTADEEDLIAARLDRPEMNSGFGLRTMSSAAGGFSPLSYHCGSVWSHDTAIVISGLVRSGHLPAAASLAGGLLDAAAAFGWRLPELFSGQSRGQLPWPSPYPPSCRPQAWATAAAGALVQVTLGLDVDVPAGTVRTSPARLHPDFPPAPIRVDGLVAGHETFSAGIGADGCGYTSGLSLTHLPAELATSPS